jgi:hypothetical protein
MPTVLATPAPLIERPTRRTTSPARSTADSLMTNALFAPALIVAGPPFTALMVTASLMTTGQAPAENDPAAASSSMMLAPPAPFANATA